MDGWHILARTGGLHSEVLASAGKLPILGLATASAMAGQPAIYLSAGVHGDEAAGPWALLEWAETHVDDLQRLPLVICPCLNPVGFANNSRLNELRHDLNRRFHLRRDPFVKAWQAFVSNFQLRLGLCLHEDYDAQGCYVYELSTPKNSIAEMLLKHTDEIMPRDPRGLIDGHKAKQGIIRRSQAPSGILGPEAIVLIDLGCPTTLTFETPSEFGLDQRIAAQLCALQAVITTT
jgi:murein peptide amidase A